MIGSKIKNAASDRFGRNRPARQAKLRTNRVGRLGRWMLWSPSRLQMTLLAVGVVMIALVLGYTARALNGANSLLREGQMARIAAEERKAERAAATTQPTTTLPALPGVPATPTARPTPTASARPAPSPKDVSQKFLDAWASGGSQKSRTTWVAAMRPYSTDGMLDNFRSVDPKSMPESLKVTVDKAVVEGDTVVTTAKAGPYGNVKLELEQVDGRWLVASLLPAHSD